MTTIDKEKLRQFYFSGASNFGSFKNASEKQSATRSNTSATSVSLSAVNMSGLDQSGIPANDQSQLVHASTVQSQTAVEAVGVGLNAARNKKVKNAVQQNANPPPPDAASAEYFRFLKQQQELQRTHNQLEEAMNRLENNRRTHQSELLKLRREAADLLADIEQSADWKLKSKYDVQQLIRDCALGLQPVELIQDVQPNLTALAQANSFLCRMKNDHNDKDAFGEYTLLVDQGIRRLSLLETVLQDGQSDITNVARVADTLLIQLESIMKLTPIETLIVEIEDQIDAYCFRVEESQQKREGAVNDGEVHIAEKLCYDIIQHHEDMLKLVQVKAGRLDSAAQEAAVIQKVRANYFEKAEQEFEQIRTKSKKLRSRCEEDIKKMFSLREKVEEIESQTAQKINDDRSRSDAFLHENSTKLELLFAKMEGLEREVEELEKERHRELQKRITEKDKDEHRKAEFAQFCAIVDQHLVPLERTMKNMDLLSHTVEVFDEFVKQGFNAVERDVQQRESLLKQIKMDSHKQHAELFRGMLIELGDIAYRKERMIEETEKNIRQAHIQQELLSETFNPNAKKFGDIKKGLLLNRDELQQDVKELKERAAVALEEFRGSEEALHEANIAFVHPVTEQELHTLALRTKMIEYKALAVGHVPGQQIVEEISELREELNASRVDVEQINQTTSGTISKAIPMIRAAAKSRR